MRNSILLVGIVFMIIISSGCGSETTYEQPGEIVIEEEPVVTTAPKTQAPDTTSPPATETPPETEAPTTRPPTTQPPTTIPPTTPPPKKELLSISFEEFDGLFGMEGSLTDIQKDALFESDYKDKYVQWTCELVDLSEAPFVKSYNMQMKCSPDTFTTDMTVTLREDQKQKALTLAKDSFVTFEARLTDFGEFLGQKADDGTILDTIDASVVKAQQAEELLKTATKASVSTMTTSWDADAEDDGIIIYPSLEDASSETVKFDGVELDVDIEIWTTKLDNNFNEVKDRQVTLGSGKIDSWRDGNMFMEGGIQVPFENIHTLPSDSSYGLLIVKIHLPDGRIMEAMDEFTRIKVD